MIPMICKENTLEEKTKGKTGNENIDRIIASSKFAKLRQQLLRSSNFQHLETRATSESESSHHQHLEDHGKDERKSSNPSNLTSNDDYDSSIPAKFLPTHGLPFTLRSSSLGFNQKGKTLIQQKSVGYNAKGRSSLSVPLTGSKSTNEHRVRFVTEAASEDNIMSRKVNSFGSPQEGSSAERTNRRVMISNLPPDATSSDIFSIVWGGKVESVKRIAQTTHASVTFRSSEGCARYLNATRGGIPNAFHEENRKIPVDIRTSSDPETVPSNYHGFNSSRCIKITGSIISWKDAEEMETLASNHVNTLESLQFRYNCILATLEIRFLSIEEAHSFLLACKQEKKWSHLDISFCEDPCASANGIHQ